MKIRLKDVAERCGLSISTVSKALKASSDITLETKERVIKVAKGLGYILDNDLDSFNDRNKKLIGLVISDIENMYFHGITRGVDDTINRSGYNMILCNTDEKFSKETEIMKLLLKKNVNGIILCPVGDQIVLYDEFKKKNIPVVVIDRKIRLAEEIDYVGINNKKASMEAIKYLIRLGHRKIAILVCNERITSIKDRLTGYLEALKKNNITIDKELICFAPDDSIVGSTELVKDLLSKNNLPTALFCTDNLMTLGSYIAAISMNVKIPSQLSILGFDDFEWSDALNPPLTAISQPIYVIGTMAAQFLMRRIEKSTSIGRQELIIDVQLKERGSVMAIQNDLNPKS